MFKQESLNKFSEKIKSFEEKTKGEIRLALLKTSDPYPGARYRLSILISFFLAAVIELFLPLNGEQSLLLVFALFLVNFFLAPFYPFRSWFILPSEKEREVKEKTMTLFYSQGLSQTKNRIGILLLVSMLERKIELLVDQGIIQKLGQEKLDQIVKEISKSFKSGQYEEGILLALAHIEDEIVKAFPEGLQDRVSNELSNSIILE